MEGARDKFFLIDAHLLAKITGLSLKEGMVAEFESPRATPFEALTKVLAVERLSDPGNLGALIRSQVAFGWENLFLLPGCCDLFNDKVIRSSASAVFRIKW